MATILTEPPRSRGAATIAALQPVDVSLTTRADGRDIITIRRLVVDLRGAEATSILTRSDLLMMLRRRRLMIEEGNKPRPHHIVRPLEEDSEEVVWEQPGLVTWLWRMGLHVDGHRGIPLIGYLGMSLLFGLTERQLIDRAAHRHDPPRARDLPLPVLEIDTGAKVVPLFDSRAVIQGGVWTGLLAPGTDINTLRAAAVRS